MNVSWIKFATNFFHNPKIMLLQNQKNGAEMVLFFVHLLTLAGEENNGGVFTMPDGSPCDAEYFSVVTGTSKQFVEACLEEFERLKMITYDGQTVCLANWSKYQSEDKLSQMRKADADRKREKRAKAKAEQITETTLHEENKNANIIKMSADSPRTRPENVRTMSGTDKDIDKDKEKDILKESQREKIKDARKFWTPSLDDVKNECLKNGYTFDPEVFFCKMQATGWLDRGSPIKDYKALMRVWQEREKSFVQKERQGKPEAPQASYDLDSFARKARNIGQYVGCS